MRQQGARQMGPEDTRAVIAAVRPLHRLMAQHDETLIVGTLQGPYLVEQSCQLGIDPMRAIDSTIFDCHNFTSLQPSPRRPATAYFLSVFHGRECYSQVLDCRLQTFVGGYKTVWMAMTASGLDPVLGPVPLALGQGLRSSGEGLAVDPAVGRRDAILVTGCEQTDTVEAVRVEQVLEGERLQKWARSGGPLKFGRRRPKSDRRDRANLICRVGAPSSFFPGRIHPLTACWLIFHASHFASPRSRQVRHCSRPDATVRHWPASRWWP